MLAHPALKNLKGLTFETNGTQSFDYYFEQFLKQWNESHGGDALTFSISPKLPCSGEPWEKAIKPGIIRKYSDIADTYLKFVVTNKEDVDDAKEAVKLYREEEFWGDVYLMPCGGVSSLYDMNKTQVAELAMKLGWRFSDRLQCSLWQNAWGT